MINLHPMPKYRRRPLRNRVTPKVVKHVLYYRVKEQQLNKTKQSQKSLTLRLYKLTVIPV